MKHADIIQTLSLEQKCALLSGGTVFTTRALPGKGIPAITLSDGPNGVRKQAGAADHLGLNPSVPATCFPTSPPWPTAGTRSLARLWAQPWAKKQRHRACRCCWAPA